MDGITFLKMSDIGQQLAQRNRRRPMSHRTFVIRDNQLGPNSSSEQCTTCALSNAYILFRMLSQSSRCVNHVVWNGPSGCVHWWLRTRRGDMGLFSHVRCRHLEQSFNQSIMQARCQTKNWPWISSSCRDEVQFTRARSQLTPYK